MPKPALPAGPEPAVSIVDSESAKKPPMKHGEPIAPSIIGKGKAKKPLSQAEVSGEEAATEPKPEVEEGTEPKKGSKRTGKKPE